MQMDESKTREAHHRVQSEVNRTAFLHEKERADIAEARVAELSASPMARVWVASDEPTMHPGFVEWLGGGCGWVRISGGMPLKRGCIFVPPGEPVPAGNPMAVVPCRVIDWPVQRGEEEPFPHSHDFSGMSAICHKCGAGNGHGNTPVMCPGRGEPGGEV